MSDSNVVLQFDVPAEIEGVPPARTRATSPVAAFCGSQNVML